jgi:3-phenylpropionate/trans-cinnamate dioxygenase ferredoxin reductase subunit
MTDDTTFAIVGAGLAGAGAATALREAGFGGRIALFGAENRLPYERPALSKGFLQGSEEEAKLLVHPADWYAEHRVELRLGDRVTSLDPRAHRLFAADGEVLRYDRLLLATGSSPRRLTVPGSGLSGVHYLRTLEDSVALRAAIAPGTRVVVVGGGWIGLETAAVARTAGAEVSVIEQAELPLLAVLGPEVARVFADLHVEHQVDLRCGGAVSAFRPRKDDASRVGAVVLTGGDEIAADVVVVGVGVTPDDHLAHAGGLDVGNGILVDERLRTSDPDVFAAGDVANAYHPGLRRRIRVEHWATALKQGPAAARAMLGLDGVYEERPYFFTDQYDLGMEYFGNVAPNATARVVIRGDLAARRFVAFWLEGTDVVAGLHVNNWDAAKTVKAIVASGRAVDPHRLVDDRTPLTDFLAPEPAGIGNTQ